MSDNYLISIKSDRLKHTLEYGRDYFSYIYSLSVWLGKGQAAVDAAEVFIFLANHHSFIQSSGISDRLSMEQSKVKRAIGLLKELGFAEYRKRGIYWTGKEWPGNMVIDDTFRYGPLIDRLHDWNPSGKDYWDLMTLTHSISAMDCPIASRHFTVCLCMSGPYMCGERNTKTVCAYFKRLDMEEIESRFLSDTFREDWKNHIEEEAEKNRCLRNYHRAKVLLADQLPYNLSEDLKKLKEILDTLPENKQVRNGFLYKWFVMIPLGKPEGYSRAELTYDYRKIFKGLTLIGRPGH